MDRLGWVDPYSDPAYSQRQVDYARASVVPHVYTPQMIINGRHGFVGSDARRATDRIHKALASDGLDIELEAVKSKEKSVTVTYEVPDPPPAAVINIAVVSSVQTTAVKRGENAGRKLREFSIVRAFKTFTLTDQKCGSIELALPDDLKDHRAASVVAYVQNRRTMRILGATETRIASRESRVKGRDSESRVS